MRVPHDSYVEWELRCACLYTQSADSFTLEVVIQYILGWELKLSRRLLWLYILTTNLHLAIASTTNCFHDCSPIHSVLSVGYSTVEGERVGDPSSVTYIITFC